MEQEAPRAGQPVVTGYSHLALTTRDLPRSVDFYTRVLGFAHAFDLPHPETGAPWVTYLYTGRGQYLELFVGGTHAIAYSKRNIGFAHVCLETADIQATARAIQDAGWPLSRPIELGCDGSWQCWVEDPDGNQIELMQFTEASPQVQVLKQEHAMEGNGDIQ